MKIDLFSTPLWIGNIDASKIKIVADQVHRTWPSQTLSTFNSEKKIEEESIQYIISIIINLLSESISHPFELSLLHVWENFYEKGDFQEPHIHTKSDLSFVIYRKTIRSNTVFLNSNKNLMAAFYNSKKKEKLFGGGGLFEPECRENQIVIFPSHLEHYVKKNDNSVTIAGNLGIKFD